MDTLTEWALAIVLAVGSLMFGAEQAEGLLGLEAEGAMAGRYISVVPDPLVQGQDGKVCYDFAGSGQTDPVVLKITITTVGGQDIVMTVKVTPSDPCAKLPVDPDGATCNIEDTSGVSNDWGGFITAPLEPIG